VPTSGKGSNGPQIEDSIVVFGPFRFDRRGLVLSKDGANLPVQPNPLAVLRCLVERPGEVLLKDELLDAVWQDAAVTENSLAEAIRMLRQALGDDPKSPTYIETVHRRGYRFVGATQRVTASDSTHNHTQQTAEQTAGGPQLHSGVPPGAAPAMGRRWYRRFGTAAAFVAGGLVVAAAISMMTTETPTVLGPTFPLDAPDGGSFSPREGLAISADGNVVALVAEDSGGRRLFTRRLDDLGLRDIAVTHMQGASQPFFSPDGRRVAYFQSSNAGLEIYDLATGQVETICDECASPPGQVGGATLGPDGSIVFAHWGDLWRVAAIGDEPKRLPTESGEGPARSYWWPSFLPGGEWVLVTMLRGHDIGGAQLGAYHVATGIIRTLINDAVSGRYVASRGDLVFARDGHLWAVSFDPESLQVSGEPTLIDSNGVWISGSTGFAAFAVSDNVLVYHPGSEYRQQDRVVSVGRTGDVEELIDDRGLYSSARPSPDGRRLALCRRDTADEIRVYDLDAREFTYRIADPPVDVCDPVWNPDGTRLAYTRNRRELVVQGFDVLDPPDVLVRSDSYLEPMDWTAGDEIIYLLDTEGSGLDIHVFDVASRRSRPLVATERNETLPRVSPDGKWLAYSVMEDWEVKVTPFAEGGTGTTVGEGVAPRWAPDGSELYYYKPGSGWMTITLTEGEDPFSEQLSPLAIRNLGSGGIEPFGDRFVQVERRVNEPPPTTEPVVVVNWAGQTRR